jgi:hypothetical protein
VQWLESFKASVGEHEEAKATITEVENALKLYMRTVGGQKATLQLQKSIADKSILDNGIEWHLQRFTDAVSFQ